LDLNVAARLVEVLQDYHVGENGVVEVVVVFVVGVLL